MKVYTANLTVTCDRCGLQQVLDAAIDERRRVGHTCLPYTWHTIDKKNFCPTCTEIVRIAMGEVSEPDLHRVAKVSRMSRFWRRAL